MIGGTEIPAGYKQVPVPESIKALIDGGLRVRMFKPLPGTNGQTILCISTTRQVELQLHDAELMVTPSQMKDRIIDPMLNALRGNQ